MTASNNCYSAKFLLLDMSYPWSTETTDNIIPALKNILLLSSSLKGDSKTQAFGCSRIEMYYEELKSITVLKSNINSILQSLDSVCKMDIGYKINFNQYKDLLEDAVSKILKDFTEKCGQNYGNINWPSQVQIVLVTRKRKLSRIAAILDDLINENVFPKLKRIDIVKLVSRSSLSNINETSESISEETSQKDNPQFQCVSESTDFVKIYETEDSKQDLNMFFKRWLLKTESCQEDVRLILDSSLTIKCDISDSILSPMNLPFGHRFSITDSLPSLGGAVTHSSIHEFHMIERINVSGICSSFIFGRTKKLFPTCSAKFSSVELKSNQKLFKALCVELKELEQGLLMKLKFGCKMEDEMSTYFFISSDGEKFYVNNVAPSELVLPERRDFIDENLEIPEEIQSAVSQCLQKLPCSEEYVPEKYLSGLYNCIQTVIKESPSKPKDQNKYPLPKTGNKRSKSPENIDAGIPKGEYVPEFLKKPKTPTSQRKRQRKNKEELQIMKEVLHPALIPQDLKDKFRKKRPSLYEAIELSDEN